MEIVGEASTFENMGSICYVHDAFNKTFDLVEYRLYLLSVDDNVQDSLDAEKEFENNELSFLSNLFKRCTG